MWSGEAPVHGEPADLACMRADKVAQLGQPHTTPSKSVKRSAMHTVIVVSSMPR